MAGGPGRASKARHSARRFSGTISHARCRPMTFLPSLIVFALAGQPAPSAFKLLDVETVEGRPVNRYRALELGETPVRPVTWEVAPPNGVRHGLVPVGPHTDSALAVAWDPNASALWLDADGDRRLARDE